MGSLGEYACDGAASTIFWIDAVEELIGMLLTPTRALVAYPVRREMRVLTHRALTE